MENKTTAILGLDLLKFVLAILIIAGHTQLFKEYPLVFHVREEFSSIAVPIFMAVSAYFFFKKIYPLSETGNPHLLVIKTVKRLIILFLSWYILMLPMTYYCFFSKATMKETIFAILFSCTFNGYWFIKALLFNTIIFYLFRHGKALWLCISLAWIIYLFFSYNYIYHFLAFPFHPYYSFYYNMAYYSIGVLLAKYGDCVFSSLHKYHLFFLWLLLFAADIFFIVITPLYRLISIPIFIILFSQLKLKERHHYKIMRNMSIILYMVQFVLIWIYDLCCDKYLDGTTIIYQRLQLSVVKFAVILTEAITISLFIIITERKYKLLRYLH